MLVRTVSRLKALEVNVHALRHTLVILWIEPADLIIEMFEQCFGYRWMSRCHRTKGQPVQSDHFGNKDLRPRFIKAEHGRHCQTGFSDSCCNRCAVTDALICARARW